ncbi:MAG: efflux transporter periplasmic adaptor subunit, partial [Limnohabitans sp.]
MAQNKKYLLAALVGIGLASGAAWWYQHKAGGGASAPATGSAPATAERVPTVEVAKVATVTLVDQGQSGGSLRSRRGGLLRPEVAGR